MQILKFQYRPFIPHCVDSSTKLHTEAASVQQ
jgi:hypothetical protein